MNEVKTVKLSCDATPLLEFLKLNRDLLAQAGQRGFSLLDFPYQLYRIEMDAGAAGASEIVVRLYPSDCFRSFCAALLAGDVDRLTIEQAGHGNSSELSSGP